MGQTINESRLTCQIKRDSIARRLVTITWGSISGFFHRNYNRFHGSYFKMFGGRSDVTLKVERNRQAKKKIVKCNYNLERILQLVQRGKSKIKSIASKAVYYKKEKSSTLVKFSPSENQRKSSPS